MLIFLICLTVKKKPGVKCYVYPVVPNKLGKVMKYEATFCISIIHLETLNIDWGKIDPKGNKRVNGQTKAMRGRYE